MSYTTPNDVIRIIGGTRRVDFGTSATSSGLGTADIGTFVLEADALIDFELAHIYGTAGFGTSTYGTRGLPTIIKRISTFLAASDTVTALFTSTQPEQYTWGDRLRKIGDDLLKELSSGQKILAGFVINDFGIPRSNQLYRDVYDNIITMGGTNLIELAFAKVVKFSERVTGTAIDGTRVYTRGVDYNVYYYGDRDSGTMFGNIRRLPNGSIGDGQDVAVDYKIYNDRIFRDDDDTKLWGYGERSRFSKNRDSWGFQ